MLSLYELDKGKNLSPQRLENVSLVCVGDSLTGWNNYGFPHEWPFFTYPQAIEELSKQKMETANFGIAGEVSSGALRLCTDAVSYLPAVNRYIFCFGANDIGIISNIEKAISGVINNLEKAAKYIQHNGKQASILNIPPVNEMYFPGKQMGLIDSKRKYANEKIEELSKRIGAGFIDIHTGMTHEHFADELHPNRAGAEFIARRLIEHMHI